jgi:hypothetical protein
MAVICVCVCVCVCQIVQTGLKVFERNSPEFPPRLMQEGLHLILPHLTKRVVKATPADVFTMLCSGQEHFDTAYGTHSQRT